MRKPNFKNDSGQTLILTALCMTILLGFVGLATDIGLMFRAKRNLQIAADSAAIAAASELYYGDYSAAGQAAATQNGVTNGSNGSVVAINNPPLYGAYANAPNNTNYVEAIVTQVQPTFFAKVAGLFSINVAARAVATMGPSQGCIYTLAPIGSGLIFNGMTVNAPTCSIVDDSAANPAALAANSGTITAASIGAVGGYTNGGANVTPAPITGIAAFSDPLGYLTPPAFTPANCMAAQTVTTPTTLVPGCYLGLTIGGTGDVVTFSPGIYIINGAFTITGTPTIAGAGVTFYLPNMTASFSDGGTETWNVTAPTAPPVNGGTYYNGVLFYEDPSDTNALTFNNALNSTLEGIIYAPAAAVSITADNTTTLYESVDAAALTLSGTGTLQDYALINNASVLTAARLVE